MIGDSYIDLDKISINNELLKVIPESIALKYCIFPFSSYKNKIHIAIKKDTKKEVINHLKFICEKEIICYTCDENKIMSLIKLHYGNVERDKVIFKLNHEEEIKNRETYELKEEINDSPVVKLTDGIIKEAIINNASDIHIEPFGKKIIIRMRIDGSLQKKLELPLNLFSSLLTRVKIMSKLNIEKKFIPQDGKMSYKYDGKYYDFRVSTLPTIFGEKIVIRILYKDKLNMSLSSLYYYENSITEIKNALKANTGMIIVTGPTGSGKSTTLYAILKDINNENKNIITIEDPVEYTMEGINQVNVNTKAGVTFYTGLKSLLRQDPDVIMLGEIRDEETAKIAIRAASTGHLLLSTLHTKDAVSSVFRFKEMGIPSYQIIDALSTIISQRLIKKICNNCKLEYEPQEEIRKLFNDEAPSKLYKGKGCSICGYTGFSGRIAICEVLNMDRDYRINILEHSDGDSMREIARKKGMVTILDQCKQMVFDGITTMDEFNSIYYGYSQQKVNYEKL